MNAVFGQLYSSAYDLLYQGKDYAAECDLLERIFEGYGDGSTRTILDLGCGTGSHVIPMAERGYEVLGVDLSNDMLDLAREKLSASPGRSRVRLEQGDATTFRTDGIFDAALLMFAVLGYCIDNRAALAALETARKHLRRGGLLFFDVWYGPAVVAERPSQRVKILPIEGGEMVRMADGELDIRHQTCTVRYEMWRIQGDRIVDRSHESHPMRYFFPRELELLLAQSGFEMLRLGQFPDLDREPDEINWNAAVVARAI